MLQLEDADMAYPYSSRRTKLGQALFVGDEGREE